MTDDLKPESELTSTPTGTYAVRLVATDAGERLPGVPFADAQMTSLDTPRVQEWIAQYPDHAIYILPDGQGQATASASADGKASLSAEIEADEYDELLAQLAG